ncbi:MAG: CBS domain-containing protein [Stackebrandtia sp.]
MTTARDLMTPNATCVRSDESIAEAARKIAEADVGALPICGADDDKIKGMITDRDIVRQVVAVGRNPSTCQAGELASDHVVMVRADDADKVLLAMSQHQVKRLPVIDDRRLVGIVAVADVARALSKERVGELVEALSEDR